MSTDHRPLILIVDDDSDMLGMLRLVLKKGCASDIVTAQSGREALEILKGGRVPDVVLSDIKMPAMDGLALLKKIREQDNSISVVIMTGYGTIDMAVEALKNGAYDFLQKPFENDELIRSIQKGLERTTLLRANRNLKEQLRTFRLPEGFIGQSPALLAATDRIARIADTDATVLIRGESGTGKEMAARALHALSSRSDRRIIIVNCPALPEQVLESELFGYSKGAFTGAVKGKKRAFPGSGRIDHCS
jgi:DNA-binding NtrC family response regulator